MQPEPVDLFSWVFDPNFSTEVALARLNVDPYGGMLIFFGDVNIYTDTGKILDFQYQILRNPNDLDVTDDVLFHKYLERVLETSLRESRHELPENKNNKADVP